MAVVGGEAVVGLSVFEEVGLDVDDKPAAGVAGVAVFVIDVGEDIETGDVVEDKRAIAVELPRLSPKTAIIKNDTANRFILGTFTLATSSWKVSEQEKCSWAQTFDIGSKAEKADSKKGKLSEHKWRKTASSTHLQYFISVSKNVSSYAGRAAG